MSLSHQIQNLTHTIQTLLTPPGAPSPTKNAHRFDGCTGAIKPLERVSDISEHWAHLSMGASG